MTDADEEDEVGHVDTPVHGVLHARCTKAGSQLIDPGYETHQNEEAEAPHRRPIANSLWRCRGELISGCRVRYSHFDSCGSVEFPACAGIMRTPDSSEASAASLSNPM